MITCMPEYIACSSQDLHALAVPQRLNLVPHQLQRSYKKNGENNHQKPFSINFGQKELYFTHTSFWFSSKSPLISSKACRRVSSW